MQDIHTHLYWESYDADREAVLARAQEAGVTTMLVVGTSIQENESALALAEKYDQLLVSVGIHPNNFRESAVAENWEAALRVQADNEKVVAIGECGLDYSESHGAITEEQKEMQKQGFIMQLELATERQLSVIVHCRATNAVSDEAYWDILKILKTYHEKLPAVVLHCYMGSVAVTEEFLRFPNIYFSFTGNITYPVKKELVGGNFDITEVVQKVPLEKIFTETDCPFLAPQQYRGKRNEPAYVVEVASKIRDLQEVAYPALATQLEKNFTKVFRIDKNWL